MKARLLIGGAPYGPDEKMVLFGAFDEAWSEIEYLYRRENVSDHAIEVGELRLAHAILAVAPLHNMDVQEIKHAALEHMALHLRDMPDPDGQSSS